MDSWNDKQIKAMEMSGGNESLVQYFSSKGIDKRMKISDKYSSKQAEFYRKRLSQTVAGQTELLVEPGSYKIEGPVEKASFARSISSASTLSSAHSANSSGNESTPSKVSDFDSNDWGDWFDEVCAPAKAVPQPAAPARQSSTIAKEQPQVVTAAKDVKEPKEIAKESQAKEIMAIKSISLAAEPAKKTKTLAKLADPEDFFSSFGVN